MREIKFRAWYQEAGTRTEFDRMYYSDSDYEHLADFFKEWHIALSNKETHVARLMQYTGLKDKNGKEIYEGDIVKVTRTNWYCPGHNKHNTDLIDHDEVYWDENRNAMSCRTIDLTRKNQPPYSSSGYLGWEDERADKNIVEVIGNIYENPELISTNL